jgi:diguanylate cyclase (GGDEF)-like protein
VPRLYTSQSEFLQAAQKAIAGAGARQPVAIIAAELDEFDRLVDAYGAPLARRIADRTVQLARCALRRGDMLTKVSESRILVVLPTAAEGAAGVAERFCSAVRTHRFTGAGEDDEGLRLTVSIGVATAPENGLYYEAALKAAEEALLRIQATGGDGAATAPPPHHEVLARPLAIDRFAGRARELTGLVKCLEEVCAGSPRLMTVLGDQGTGTGYLLRQLEPEVRVRGGALITVSCTDGEVRQPYGPWEGVIRAVLRLPGAPQGKWSELPHLVPELPPDAAAASEHARSQYRLLQELTDFLRAAAATHPLVLVFDEMQWADSASWDALEHLLGRLGRDRIMICLAMRTERGRNESEEYRRVVAGHPLNREMPLAPLTREEVKQWLLAVFHKQEVGRELLAFIYRHTEGNPFAIAQLLHAMAEEGAIWHNGRRWEWKPVSELRYPTGGAALVRHRINRFSSTAQAVLTIAAVVGRLFHTKLLVGSGAGSEAAVRLALSEALGAALIRPAHERHEGAYEFGHEQMTSVLTEAADRERLKNIHQRVARAIDARDGGAGGRAGEIAKHYDAAGVMEGAYRAGRKAAHHAEQLYATAQASGYLHLAARNASTPAELAEVRVELAQLAESVGRHDEVEELCDLTIEWFESQADRKRALTLKWMRERARMGMGQPARATLDSLIKLDAEAQEIGAGRERVSILLMISLAQGRLGDARTSERIAGEGVAMAEALGEPALLAEALNRHAVSIMHRDAAGAHASYQRALHIYESLGDVRGQARSFNNIGLAAHLDGRVAEAEEAWAMAMAVARPAGIADVLASAMLNLGLLAHKRGDYGVARKQFSDAIDLLASVKNSEVQLIALYNLAHVERETGLWGSAVELYEMTESLAVRVGQSDIEIGALAGAGLCLLELDRPEEAAQNLEQVETMMAGRPEWFQGREMVEALAVRLLVTAGRCEDALVRLTASLDLAESAELYAAAWLTAACASAVRPFDAERVAEFIRRYAPRVADLGYSEMTRRYDALMSE